MESGRLISIKGCSKVLGMTQDNLEEHFILRVAPRICFIGWSVSPSSLAAFIHDGSFSRSQDLHLLSACLFAGPGQIEVHTLDPSPNSSSFSLHFFYHFLLRDLASWLREGFQCELFADGDFVE